MRERASVRLRGCEREREKVRDRAREGERMSECES